MDPAKMKVVDLRSELGALGLDTKGNKPALVERLKKALEAKSGKAIPDTSILDTSSEEVPETPKKERPALRTSRRRSSSSRLGVGTPAKQLSREEVPAPIVEEEPAKPATPPRDPTPEPPRDPTPEPPREPTPEPPREPTPEPPREPTPEPVREPTPEPVAAPQPVPQPVAAPVAEPEPEKQPEKQATSQGQDMYSIDDDDDRSNSPIEGQDKDEKMDAESQEESPKEESNDKPEKMDTGEDSKEQEKKQLRKHEPTEEEEWAELNERLKIREQERIEREKKQAEEDAKKLEEFKDDPVKLQRLKRKREKKARWSNYYRTIEATQEILTPPAEDEFLKKNEKEVIETKMQEPEIDESKITLSWYDSDLNQYLEPPALCSVVPLSEGAFAHAWAGARATHGVDDRTVCYEVRVGSVVTTTESAEKDTMPSGLRIGWSTDDCSLHLGDSELSWGYESTGRAVNDAVFKEYGKKLEEKDVVGAYLDLESNPCTISYTVNGQEQGVAYEFDKSLLDGKALFPHILTKNTCYTVNFGNDRYNMLTKTKIVRRRIEVPVEQVLREKKAKEEELQRIKEEALRIEKEKKEKERLEKEERLQKKKEEKEKQEREKKEKEAAERRERGEPESEGEGRGEEENQPELKENGDNPVEPQESEAKAEEPMETSELQSEETQDKEEGGEAQEMTEEQVYQGAVLDKRIKFVIRYTVEEELDGEEASMLPGYIFICNAQLIPGPRQPATLADCETILMVGMPGSGKTYWAKQHCAQNPDKRYQIISTGALFDKMKVDCKQFRASYEGRWDAMVSKCAKCVLKLLEIAKGRRRNYILDQTNVYPSAQRRKMREFDGYRRLAVVVVTDSDTYKERQAQRHAADGKEVPDPAVLDMKANFTLPEKCSWIDDVLYPELPEDQARLVLEEFHKEARAAGVVREREKRERSEGRDAPVNKRSRSSEKKRREERREGGGRWGSREREDRWSGGGGGVGGGGRWGPPLRGAPGGGGRWGRGPPPPRTNDRWGPPRGGDFGRNDRDGGFRGGRGGRGERGGPRGPPGHAGPPGPGHMGHGGDGYSRFGRGGGDRGLSRGPPGAMDKRPGGPPGPGGNPPGAWRGGRGGGNNRQNSMQNKDNGGQGGNQAAWNQWGNWGNWGNWQNQGQNWNNWNNWNSWNQQQQPQSGQPSQSTNKPSQPPATTTTNQQQTQQQQQWGNYTAQQWYQWQQWQQQQQGWQQYQQQQQAAGGGQQTTQTNNDAAQAAWAQYYQNYGANAAQQGAANNAVAGADKK